MVGDIFSSIIEDLGKSLNLPLKPDQYNRCLFQMPNGTMIQLEMDTRGDFLIMGSELGVVNPGRYRIDVFRESLKANTIPDTRYGTFAWNKKSNQLIFFKKFAIKDLNAEKIATVITPFSEIALKWKEAIDQGHIPSLIPTQSPVQGGIFGLIK